MAVRKEDALSVELVDVGTQKEGRYRKRQHLYTFACISCPTGTITVTSYDLKKVSGRCRLCASFVGAEKTARKNRKRPYEALFNKFDYDRRRAGQTNGLTFEDFLEFVAIEECHYCGAAVEWTEFCLSSHHSRYNLDRKDNAVGYEKDNLVVCCWPCNELKSSRFTYQQFLKVATLVATFTS